MSKVGQYEFTAGVIDLFLSLLEAAFHLRNIPELKPEYRSEFVEPFIKEMHERQQVVLERYWQKYGLEDGDDEVFRTVLELLSTKEQKIVVDNFFHSRLFVD